MVLTVRKPLAMAKTKLQSAEKIAASVRGLIKDNSLSLGRMANHAPTAAGTAQMSKPRSEAKFALTIPRIMIS